MCKSSGSLFRGKQILSGFRFSRASFAIGAASIILSNSIQAQGLVISQYVETDSGTTPKGIEIWNSGTSSIDFGSSSLFVQQGTNGGSLSTINGATVSSGILKGGEVIVIGTSDIGTFLSSSSVTSGTRYVDQGFTFNGDDALRILLGTIAQDTFGTPGSDPGSSWSGAGADTRNQNIQLLSGISTGSGTTGFTDPSGKYVTVSTSPSSAGGLAGFGIGPTTWVGTGSASTWETGTTGKFQVDYADSLTTTAIFKATGEAVSVVDTVQTGAIRFASDGYSLEGGTIEMGVGGVEVVGSTVTASISSDITGSDGLAKTGVGTLELSGTNTFTGITSVAEGTLVIDGSVASDVAVSAGATLGGSATIGGDLALTSGSMFAWELSAPSADPGALPNQGNYDQTAVTGALSGTSTFMINLVGSSFDDPFWDTAKSWTNILTSSGPSTLEDVFTSFGGTGVTSTGATDAGQFTFNGNTLSFAPGGFAAVPEPTSALAGLLVAAGLMRRSRKAGK